MTDEKWKCLFYFKVLQKERAQTKTSAIIRVLIIKTTYFIAVNDLFLWRQR